MTIGPRGTRIQMSLVLRSNGERRRVPIPLIGVCTLVLVLFSACDTGTELFVTNDSSVDVAVRINGRTDRDPIIIKAGTEAGAGGVINKRIKTVEVFAVDSSREFIPNEPSARFEFPGDGTWGGRAGAVSLRVTGPPLHLEQVELKPSQKSSG